MRFETESGPFVVSGPGYCQKIGGVLMTYRDPESPSGLAVLTLGWTKKELVELDGIWVNHAAPGSLKNE